MSDSTTYQSLIDKVRVLSDYLFQMDRTDGRVVENGQTIFSGTKDAAIMLKITTLSEPDQFQSIIIDVNSKFQQLFGLSSEQVVNQSISVIESIKGIKFFDWNNMSREISHGKGHGIFDFFSPQLSKWLKFITITPEEGLLIILITDITETKSSLIPHYVKFQNESANENFEE